MYLKNRRKISGLGHASAHLQSQNCNARLFKIVPCHTDACVQLKSTLRKALCTCAFLCKFTAQSSPLFPTQLPAVGAPPNPLASPAAHTRAQIFNLYIIVTRYPQNCTRTSLFDICNAHAPSTLTLLWLQGGWTQGMVDECQTARKNAPHDECINGSAQKSTAAHH